MESFSIESYSKSSDAYDIRNWTKSSIAAVCVRPNVSVSFVSQHSADTLNILNNIEEESAHEYRLHDFLENDDCCVMTQHEHCPYGHSQTQ